MLAFSRFGSTCARMQNRSICAPDHRAAGYAPGSEPVGQVTVEVPQAVAQAVTVGASCEITPVSRLTIASPWLSEYTVADCGRPLAEAGFGTHCQNGYGPWLHDESGLQLPGKSSPAVATGTVSFAGPVTMIVPMGR